MYLPIYLLQTAPHSHYLGLGGLVLILILSFLIGGVPFGYMAGRLKGVDIRTLGSGNIGATNVYRNVGKSWGVAVFILDFLKAFLPVFFLLRILGNGQWELTLLPLDVFAILAGATIVVGHNYSVFMGFKGGKGMASSAGFIFALFPISGLVALSTFMVVFLWSKFISAGSVAAAIVLPIATVFLYPERYWLWAVALFLGVMSVWRHRSNIQRLRAGTELRAGSKK
ncbi:MAG: glycerol-3-phosphate 1-O-acyltransferase PlsY [Blastochloris sp.]|jgi:glycerol-3-phosphate acyltransferase PlsY|nr:glycerol-3-phosphate 1-O-acyltransferase PlsY [Blastochloris sp.]